MQHSLRDSSFHQPIDVLTESVITNQGPTQMNYDLEPCDTGKTQQGVQKSQRVSKAHYLNPYHRQESSDNLSIGFDQIALPKDYEFA